MDNEEWPIRRKTKKEKRCAIRDAKVHGEMHVNHVGKLIPQRTTGDECRCSRSHCFTKINAEKQHQILDVFNSFSSKDEQDSHLSGLISVHVIARKRPRLSDKDMRKDHSASYSYKIRIEGKEEPICQKAFLSFHGISKHRLNRIQQSLLTTGKSPKTKQGHHENRPNKLPQNIAYLVENHIKSYKARKSHYSMRDNPGRRYLPEDLTVSEMHQHFLEMYHINISYKSYWSIFKTFNIHFGYPRSDTCAICDSLQQQINAASNDDEKTKITAQKKLHLQKVEAFLTLKRKFIMKAKAGEITCLSFDFMQNLPLPHIKSGPVYYSRQLWYNVFGVHNLCNDSVTMYRYLEHEGKKGPNEVTSMLLDTVNNLSESVKHDELVLISDGCPGQNKNKIMVQFLHCLVHIFKQFKKITYLFPIRGHSYLPNDQDFALIGNKKKKLIEAPLPDTWDDVILSARKHPEPFHLKVMTHHDFFDMKTAMSHLFLTLPKPPLRLQEVRMMVFHEDDLHVGLKKSYFGSWERHIVRRRPHQKNITTLDLPRLYMSPPGIKAAKKADVMKLSKYLVNPEDRQYYESLMDSLRIETNEYCIEDNIEVDNDDNSGGCSD